MKYFTLEKSFQQNDPHYPVLWETFSSKQYKSHKIAYMPAWNLYLRDYSESEGVCLIILECFTSCFKMNIKNEIYVWKYLFRLALYLLRWLGENVYVFLMEIVRDWLVLDLCAISTLVIVVRLCGLVSSKIIGYASNSITKFRQGSLVNIYWT